MDVHFAVVYHVDVGAVDGFDVANQRVDTHGQSAVNAGYGNTVTWLHFVDQVVVSVYNHSMGCLSSRHVIYRAQNL